MHRVMHLDYINFNCVKYHTEPSAKKPSFDVKQKIKELMSESKYSFAKKLTRPKAPVRTFGINKGVSHAIQKPKEIKREEVR